ncbi:type II toxin-antitoxin system VapC family toxin [uncultured Sphaerochaeta sp.]|uniref:type II toxin-antitoxin system VapC family toxin n=1 Tax=uncultured Sphaerochaeta sp. TaxID=886478 RepID=UPI002A0A2ACA|nr:type II toxin-antitoxin system VapC family toxin [uncultured Sphaerochaeta sp.]
MNKPLLCDANILIDYVNASPTLLLRISQFYRGIFVPDIVYAEVTPIKEIDPSDLGIILLETPFEELETVAGLSIQDCCCLYYAQNGYYCVTNDIRLRKTCISKECTVIWGLELLLQFNKEGKISKQEAMILATNMQKENPTLTTSILRDFETKLIP